MKLPNKLLLAIARYYINRSSHDKTVYSGTGYKLVETAASKWDKEADLDFIDKNCPEGISHSAISGTFWFSKGKKRIEINESNFCEHIR